jgi:pimeloyl-ACP methyl ester carboxylesterase
VVYVLGFSQVDLRWEDEVFAGFQERLASLSRLILVDRRGTGASTPSPTRPCRRGRSGPTTCEPCSTPPEQAAVLAETDGGPTGLPFTATQPDRVSGLILANSTARRLRADDYPIGIAPEAVDDLVEAYRAARGSPDTVAALLSEQRR